MMPTPNVDPSLILAAPEPKLPSRNQMMQLDVQREQANEPVWEKPDEQLFIKLKQWFEEGRDRTQKWREEAEVCFDLTAGWQWDADDMQVLADDNRPSVTFNRIGRNIDLVSGIETQSRQDVAFLPREEGDVGKSEVLSSAVEYISDETDSVDEKSDAFRDLCICGMGWTNTVMDFRDFDDGMPVESRIDPLEMFWDPHSRQRNLKDSRWRARARIMPTVEAQRMFPGIDPAMLNAAWAQIADDPTQPSEPDRQSYNYEDSPTEGQPPLLQRSTIVEMQWWEIEKRVILEDLFTAERKEMSADRARAIMAEFPGRYESVEIERKVFFRAFLGGMLLRKVRLEKVKDFTFQVMTGKRDRRSSWYGMVRLMADPQRWANKWLSQSMHIMNTGAKNGLWYEEGSLVDAQRAERDHAKPGSFTAVSQGALTEGRVREKQPGAFPQELHNLLPFALQSIQDCVGVNAEQLGMTGGTDANRAALLESERRKAGITLMAQFFDAKRLFTKRQGRLLLRYILTYMNDGRLIRVVSDGNKSYARLLVEDPQSVKYDIVVDDAPDAPNQRDKTWATLVPMLPMLERLQPPPEIWIKVLRYSPLPAQLVNDLEEDLKQSEGDQAQQDPKDAKIPAEIEKIMAEIEKLKADAARLQTAATLNIAKARESRARVEMDAIEGIRETVAIDDAERHNRLTAHESA